MKVLILTDGKAGHQSQSIALALSLGMDYDLIEVHFKNGFAKRMSYLFDRMHILCSRLFSADWIPESGQGYAFVAGTGSGTFYPVKVIARQLQLESRVILYPRGYRMDSYSLIYAPLHDRAASGPNIVNIKGAFVFASASMKDEAVRRFVEQYDGGTRNAAAFVIGGPSHYATMNVEWLKAHLDAFFAETDAYNRQHPDGRRQAWVTTSRRTPAEIESLIERYPWDYCLINSKNSYNPVLAFAVLSQQVYVTAESISMVSELADAASGQVYLLDNLKPGSHKLRRFANSMGLPAYSVPMSLNVTNND